MAENDKPAGAASTQIQDFIFVRELSEVYLLLDHISGRWDKSLYTEKPTPERRDPNWIEAICQIGWPVQGSKIELAKQAAVLIGAKDRLNAAARPATGATIAFTLLVVGESAAELPWWRRLLARPRPAREEAPLPLLARVAEPHTGFTRPPTRMSLARTAFPGMVTTAERFERRIRLIVWFLFGWLVLTCALSWNVTAGTLILAHLDKIKAQTLVIAKDIRSAESSLLEASARAGDAAPRQIVRFCDRPQIITPAVAGLAGVRRYDTVEQIHLCDALRDNQREKAVIGANVTAWLAPWTWLNMGQRRNGSADDNGSDEEAIRILTQLMANAVLPLFYGILGAGAAVVRDLWGKMRESMLSPRDYTLALGQLALGAVIGACIGLFITPSGAGNAEGLIGGLALTGSALSFIAGFGVEGVFLALESLVRRVFNMPEKGTRA